MASNSPKPLQPDLPPDIVNELRKVANIGPWQFSENEGLIWSDGALEIFGLTRESFTGSVDQFLSLIHPEDKNQIKRIEELNSTDKRFFRSAYRIFRPSGELRYIQQTAVIQKDFKGKVVGFCGFVQDVTEQSLLEEQLRQAQKLEAIGLLSGGIAHDFNNILATIMAAAETLLNESNEHNATIETILRVAENGGRLTKSLLSYARQRPFHLEKINPSDTIVRLLPMIKLTIGNEIAIELDVSTNIKKTYIDVKTLEESLVNLTLNAKEAIAGAGTIRICCMSTRHKSSNGTEEDFIRISIEDNGTGMDENDLAKATEPFFTTKEIGKGSGLGLSLVDGFSKQAGGDFILSSQKGK